MEPYCCETSVTLSKPTCGAVFSHFLELRVPALAVFAILVPGLRVLCCLAPRLAQVVLSAAGTQQVERMAGPTQPTKPAARIHPIAAVTVVLTHS